MKSRRTTLAVLAAASALMLAACGGSSGTTTSSSPAAGAAASADAPAASAAAAEVSLQGKRVEFVVGRLGDPFVAQEICGANDAAAKYGLDVTATGPGVWSATDQLPFLNAAVAKDPDALLLEATDSAALNQAVKPFVDTGKPFVTVDAGISEDWPLAFIASDNKAGGVLAAQEMAKAIGEKGKVLVVNLAPGIGILDERQFGFEEEIKKYPNIEYLGAQFGGDDPTKIAGIVSATLAAHPDLAGIYATATLLGESSGAAIQEAGVSDQVFVVSFDASDRLTELLKSGGIDALIVQKPYQMGYNAMEAVAAALQGKEYTGETVTDYVVATAENVDTPEVSKWMYSTVCKN